MQHIKSHVFYLIIFFEKHCQPAKNCGGYVLGFFLYLEVYSCLDHIKMFSAGEHYNAGRGFYKNIYFLNIKKKKLFINIYLYG